MNHIIRLESSVSMVVDSKSKSKPKPWVLKMRTGRASKLRCDMQ